MEAHTGYLDDEKSISELAANNNLDLAVTEPDFNEENVMMELIEVMDSKVVSDC